MVQQVRFELNSPTQYVSSLPDGDDYTGPLLPSEKEKLRGSVIMKGIANARSPDNKSFFMTTSKLQREARNEQRTKLTQSKMASFMK